MPFQSEKQKGYLLAHPEITDKKGRSVGRKWAKKYGTQVAKSNKSDMMKLVGVGTGSTVLANQVPPVQEIVRAQKKKRKRKVAKNFNYRAARAAYDIVMKMDDESAEMFARIVVADMLEKDIERNLPVLQNHLNQVVEKRLSQASQAVAKKIQEEPTAEWGEVAKALATISKKTPYDYGYRFRESDFNRDPGSGQFRSKVVYSQRKPVSDRAAKALGIKGTEKKQYQKLSPKQQAEYQDAYRQLSYFLQAARHGQQGKKDEAFNDVLLTYKDKNGQTYSELHTGARPNVNNLLDPETTLIGMTARPNALTVGGAAFGLSTALGGYGERQRVAGQTLDNIDDHFGGFTKDWNTVGETDDMNQNAGLYRRITSGSQFVQDVAPLGSKAQVAGRLAQFVGDHGSEAEQVFGPTARKTAYRYRGTEKTPDAHIVTLYTREINRAKSAGIQDEAEEIQYTRGAAPKADELGMRRSGTKAMTPSAPDTTKSPMQMAIAREAAEYRAPNWAERAGGRKVIIDQLRFKTPDKGLYALQLASGNTPPSEGIMLNKNGQIAAQAVGYGDDHYIPFNLRNLKALKGGEYIRTRSVGGLTSEDIYVGLISGARQVTVVSRSGVFSMEFNEDFRGGRRHNDKARRMTRRYQQLLDAVQSEKVTRHQIPDPIRRQIMGKVREENPGESASVIRTLTEEKVREYRESPDITPEDEELMTRLWMAGMTSDPSRDAKQYRAEVQALVANNKDYLFRLDGNGYAAGLRALEEQFPYYIKTNSVVEDERDLTNVERDRGYVEPGRNRPTEAKAGLYGTKDRLPELGNAGRKFSASQADYQGHRSQTIKDNGAVVGTEDAEGTEGAEGAAGSETPKTEEDKIKEQLAKPAAEMGRRRAARNLHEAFKNSPQPVKLPDEALTLFAMEPGEFAEAIKIDANMKTFDDTVTLLKVNQGRLKDARMVKAINDYVAVRTGKGPEKLKEGKLHIWPVVPYDFEKENLAYKKGDSEVHKNARRIQREKIDRRTRSVLKGGNLSDLNEDELRNELSTRADIEKLVKEYPILTSKTNDAGRRAARAQFFDQFNTAAINSMLETPEKRERGMEDVHRMRALNALEGRNQGAGDSRPPVAPRTVEPGVKDPEERQMDRKELAEKLLRLKAYAQDQISQAQDQAKADKLTDFVNLADSTHANIDDMDDEELRIVLNELQAIAHKVVNGDNG